MRHTLSPVERLLNASLRPPRFVSRRAFLKRRKSLRGSTTIHRRSLSAIVKKPQYRKTTRRIRFERSLRLGAALGDLVLHMANCEGFTRLILKSLEDPVQYEFTRQIRFQVRRRQHATHYARYGFTPSLPYQYRTLN